MLINIVSKEDIAYYVAIGDIPLGACLDFTKMSSQSIGGGKMDVLQTFLLLCLDLCTRWITMSEVHSLSNAYLQQGYAATSTCYCCGL